MAIIDIKNALLKIYDRGSNSITVSIGEGNLEYTTKQNIEYVKRRGLLSTTREGDEEPIDVSFSFVWEHITSLGETTSTPNPEEALLGIGEASAWVSASSDVDAPYCTNLVLVYNPLCGGTQTLTFPLFTSEELAHSLRDGTIDCKGKCNTTSPTSS